MKLLLHICCGPCALYPIKDLLCRGTACRAPTHFDKITGFFYNPNIHPPSEYKKRKDALSIAADRLDLEIIIPDYKMEEYFIEICRGTACRAPTERCSICWELRLKRTASFAKDNGFDAFTTTLLISPYQDHEKVKKIGEKIAAESGVQFYYQDFRPGFREGQEKAKEENLYRQKYCGCVFSELERVNIK